jgi:hypothetical protein
MGATGGASHFRCHLYPSCYDSNALFSLILYINALPNRDIRALFEQVQLGTPVIVEP